LNLRTAILAFVSVVFPVVAGAADLAFEREYNNRVRIELVKLGDDGSVPREVHHWGYPLSVEGKSTASYDDIAAELIARGFVVQPAVVDGGIRLMHHAAVAGPAFDGLTGELRDLFTEQGWDYDGWECQVLENPLTG